MRTLLSALFILSLGQLIQAQGRFAIKAGPNLSLLTSENDKTQDYSSAQVGFILGTSYELVATKRFSVQPEINYAYQVAKEIYFGSKIKLGYAQFPILLKFNIPNSLVSIYAGPQLNFLTRAKKEISGNSTDVEDNFTKTDFGPTFGLSHAPASSGVTFDVRIFRGLLNAIKSEFDGYKEPECIYHCYRWIHFWKQKIISAIKLNC